MREVKREFGLNWTAGKHGFDGVDDVREVCRPVLLFVWEVVGGWLHFGSGIMDG